MMIEIEELANARIAELIQTAKNALEEAAEIASRYNLYFRFSMDGDTTLYFDSDEGGWHGSNY